VHVLTLSLDTSSPVGSLAVLRRDSLLAVVSTSTEENYSSRMFRHLEFLLKDLSLTLADFDLFSVAAGPGSFTGLRVGLTAAKGWAEVYRKPVVGVSALEAVAIQAFLDDLQPPTTVIPVLDARRGQLYCAFYSSSPRSPLKIEGDACVMSPEELSAEIERRIAGTAASDSKQKIVIATPDPALLSSCTSRFEKIAAHRKNVSIIIQPVSAILAPAIGRIGYASAKRGEVSDALTLDANYVRRSDAELQLKGK
jgi:tRNA threonylcarbamoyladenosine biosynthesis protein TsaB